MNPPQFRPEFFDLRPDEKVILFLHRHWITWIVNLGQLLVFNLLPIGLVAFFNLALGWTLDPASPIYVGLVLLLSIYYLGAWLMYYHAFIDYHLDIWLLTDQRIISIEQQGLFDRIISELNMSKVQDVTSETRGQMQTFLNYGAVYIQTAAEKERFIFENIPHPEEVARIIMHANDAALKKDNGQRTEQHTDSAAATD